MRGNLQVVDANRLPWCREPAAFWNRSQYSWTSVYSGHSSARMLSRARQWAADRLQIWRAGCC